MTGQQIEHIRNELGLTHPQFAQLLGVHVTTIYRWVNSSSEEVRLDPLHASLAASRDRWKFSEDFQERASGKYCYCYAA